MGPISQADLLPELFEGSGAPAHPLLGIPLKCGEASNRCVKLAWPWPKVGRGVAGTRLNLRLGWSRESKRLYVVAVPSSHSPERREGMLTFTRQISVSCSPLFCSLSGSGQRARELQLPVPPLREAAGWLPGQMLTNCIRKEVGGNRADSDPWFKNPEPG